jgi:hypothetical protein
VPSLWWNSVFAKQRVLPKISSSLSGEEDDEK